MKDINTKHHLQNTYKMENQQIRKRCHQTTKCSRPTQVQPDLEIPEINTEEKESENTICSTKKMEQPQKQLKRDKRDGQNG